MKKSRLLQAALAVLALPAMLGAATPAPADPRGPALEYGKIVTIVTGPNHPAGARIFWVHQSAATTGTQNPANASSGAHEILIGSEATEQRTKNGSQFFILKYAADSAKTGPVAYGDEVAIYSLAARQAENQALSTWPLTRRWFVRLSGHGTDGHTGCSESNADILVNNAAAAPANAGKFKLQNVKGMEGPVYQSDVFWILSAQADATNGKKVWVNDFGRYGPDHRELLVTDNAKAAEQGKVQIKALSFDTLSNIQGDSAKQAWMNLKNAGLGMTVEAKDAGALSALSAGTQVSFFVPKYDKYLQAQADGKLKATGAASTDPACQFTVLRHDNWVGFQSKTAGGKNLGAVPGSHATGFTTTNFDIWEYWAVNPEDPNSLRGVHLRNPSSFGYLSVPNSTAADWTGGYVSTAGNKVGNTFVVADETGDKTRIDIDVLPNPPMNFAAEVGNGDFIGCGSDGKGGALVVMARGDNLLKYDPYTMAKNPWSPMDASDATGPLGVIEGLTVSSFDGAVCVIAKGGLPYKHDAATNKFVLMPLGVGNEKARFLNIATGNPGNTWGVTTDKDLVKFEANGITPVAKGVAINVTACADGTVIATNEAGHAFRYLGPNKFQQLGTGVSAEDIAVVNKNTAYCIDGGVVYQLVNGVWTALKGADGNNATGFKAVAASAAGTAILLDANGDVFHNEIKGFTVTAPPAPAVAPGMPAAATGVIVIASQKTRAQAAAVGEINIAEDKKSDKQKRVVAEKAKTTNLQTFNKQLKDVQKKLKKATGAAKATLQKQEKDLKAKIKKLQKKAKKKPTAKAKKAGKKKAGKKVAGKKAAGKKAAGKKAAGKKAAGKKAAGKKAAGKKAAAKR